jgi:DNA-directed RNA polymerase subunit RPC12/RpoP
MQVYKETIWHFTCNACTGFWSIAASDEWVPTELFCPHCSSKRIYNKELTEQVDEYDYLPESKNTQLEHYYEFEDEFGDIEELKKSTIVPDPDIEYTDEWCSCGHKKLDCDCKAGCNCGCNSRFLHAY